MYKYNSINHTNEKTEAFYCLKNNYDKEKTDYPFMHLLYSQLLVCQRVCLQNTVCLICK